jgi:hypothetical protein
MTTTTADSSRVYFFSKVLREKIKRVRAEKELRQQDFFEESIDEHLPIIVGALKELGFEATKKGGPVKMPVREPVLKALRRATAVTGIPTTSLVQTILIQATREESKPKPRRKAKAKPRQRAKAK